MFRGVLTVCALLAAQTTTHAQGYVPTKSTPQATAQFTYPTGQSAYPTARPYIPGTFDVPCPCPFPSGYCAFPTGYCPLPNNQCGGLPSAQGTFLGTPQGSYGTAPCSPCAATQSAPAYLSPQSAVRVPARTVR